MTGRIPRVADLVTEAVDRLRQAGVTMNHGLSDHELAHIEKSLGFAFGPEHRQLLATALPTGERWPDWRHASSEDLLALVQWPHDGAIFDVHNNGFWPSSWDERPEDAAIAESYARRRLNEVPRLLPLYGHRFMATDPAYVPSPVFSVYQTDVIYYGDNLLDYVAHEFGVPPLHPGPARTHVPFWSDLAEGAGAGDL